MIDIITIIKDYFKSKSLQEFINNRFWDTNRIIIPDALDKNGKYDLSTWMKIVSKDGKTFFYWDDLVTTIASVKREYSYKDIKPSDIVLDIGGCIGAYGLQISHNVSKVFIVEPLLHERIEKNIQLTNKLTNNTIKNVQVLKCALGTTGTVEINFRWMKTTAQCYTLSELISKCGGHIDVLKVDCEGAEWCILPTELKDIRRIEMEIHTGTTKEWNNGISRKEAKTIVLTSDNKSYKDYISMLESTGFNCEYEIIGSNTTLIHGFKK